MKFIKNNLLSNEKILHIIRPHWIVFSNGIWALIFAFYVRFYAPERLNFDVMHGWTSYSVLAAALAISGIYWTIDALITYLASEYGITNKRVIMKSGWIRRNSLEIVLEKVEGVLVDQSVFGRIFNYGLITIIGTGGTKDRFDYIPDPLLFRKNIQQQVDALEHRDRD